MALKLVPRGLGTRELWFLVWLVAAALLLLLTPLVVPMITGWSADEVPLWWAWSDSVLISVGAAIGLLVPIELIGTRLRRSVEAADERQDQRVQEVREQSESKFAEVSERLDSLEGLKRRVSERIDDKIADEHAAFRSVAAEDATGANALRALTRARQRGLVSARGVRVPYDEEGSLHVQFRTTNNTQILLIVTDEDQQRVVNVPWGKTMTAEDMLFQLASSVRSKGRDALPSPEMILTGFAEALVHANSHEFARPIIQYFPPQWALTDTAIVASGRGSGMGWDIGHKRADRRRMYRSAHEKQWLDVESFEAAQAAAEKIFPLTDEQRGQPQ